jgi:hypothetical protein
MSNTELLLKEIEGLSPDYMNEILDFVGYLKHKTPPGEFWCQAPFLQLYTGKLPA